MDQSKRAVESYWRSKMVEGATSDEDKVTPVYKLEEICDLIRSSHVSIVKEVAEFILKRLQHKSPIVKQKALRVIKYVVGKSGAEFRREMQRNSADIRQLIHYKGHPDPLKGDALNKAVRETAQEALSSLFSSEESKPSPAESSLGNRIQGFGSTNYEMPSEDRKSFISEVVDIGSATIKQGLSNFMQPTSLRKNNDTGSYRSPNLQRSLTRENDYSDRNEGIGYQAPTDNISRFSKNAGSGNWGQDMGPSEVEPANGESSLTYGQKTREEKLLETIVTCGGVRLQPTRDALHVFLMEASKVNALALGHAIETKLKSPMWQVRMKAICVLEAVLRKKDDEHFAVVASYFSHNYDVVVKCCESPQASLREKANKVFGMLDGEQGGVNLAEKSTKSSQTSMMADLIDTDDHDDLVEVEDAQKIENGPRVTHASTSVPSLIGDLLGDSFTVEKSSSTTKIEDDPFVDVSFHTSQDKHSVADIFSGMTVDSAKVGTSVVPDKTELESLKIFNSSSEDLLVHGDPVKDVNDLMDNLSVNGYNMFKKQNESSVEMVSGNVGSISGVYPNMPSSSAFGINANHMFPLGVMPSNFPSTLMFNQSSSHHMNYNVMGNLFAQQQFLATMTQSNFQQLGNLHSNASLNDSSKGANPLPLPDIFGPGISTQPPASHISDSKRNETKAFDFVSDHLAAAREQKRLI